MWQRRAWIRRTPFVCAPPEVGSRRWLKAELDRLTSLIVRRLEPACVLCGSRFQLTNGHIYSRRNLPTRWDITPDGNCHGQCWNCNRAHIANPFPYVCWYEDKFGSEALERLHQRWLSVQKFEDWDLRNMVTSHTAFLRGL
jgi:hypothetical protein